MATFCQLLQGRKCQCWSKKDKRQKSSKIVGRHLWTFSPCMELLVKNYIFAFSFLSDPGNVSGDGQKSKSTPATPSKPMGLGTFLTSGGNGNQTRVPTGNRPATALPSSTSTASVLNNSNLHWACTKCTYDNHPALKECEQCEMPRFS